MNLKKFRILPSETVGSLALALGSSQSCTDGQELEISH